MLIVETQNAKCPRDAFTSCCENYRKEKKSPFSGVPISYPPIKGLTEQNGEGDQGEGHQLPERQRPDPGHTGWGHRRGDFWPESSDARRYVCTLTYLYVPLLNSVKKP